MKKTFDVNIDMFHKDVFDGYYFADNNSVNYDLQNGKIETIAFCVAKIVTGKHIYIYIKSFFHYSSSPFLNTRSYFNSHFN